MSGPTVLGLVAIAALLGLGVTGQRLAERRDRRRFPMPGSLIDAGGVSLHVVVDGSGPVVLIDSGLGGSSLEWDAVAADLSRNFTVVRNDRPGFGWSPPAAGDFSPLTAARRIRALLAALDVPLAAILVGHSLGGLHVRVAAALYPEIVTGLVLVDPSHEEMLDGDDVPRSAAIVGRVMGAVAAIAPLGLARIVGRLYGRMVAHELRRPLDPAGSDVVKRSTLLTACSAAGLRAVAGEMSALPASLDQVKQLTREHQVPAVPVTVISADAPGRTPTERKAREDIRALHARQAAAAPFGRLVLAEASGHLVPLDDPELIARCVRETAIAATAGRWDEPTAAPAPQDPPSTDEVTTS